MKLKKYLQTTLDGRILKPKEKTRRKKQINIQTQQFDPSDPKQNEESSTPPMQHDSMSISPAQDATGPAILNVDVSTSDIPQQVVQLRKKKIDKVKRALSTVSTDLTPFRKVQIPSQRDTPLIKPMGSTTLGSTNGEDHDVNLPSKVDSFLPPRPIAKGKRSSNADKSGDKSCSSKGSGAENTPVAALKYNTLDRGVEMQGNSRTGLIEEESNGPGSSVHTPGEAASGAEAYIEASLNLELLDPKVKEHIERLQRENVELRNMLLNPGISNAASLNEINENENIQAAAHMDEIVAVPLGINEIPAAHLGMNQENEVDPAGINEEIQDAVPPVDLMTIWEWNLETCEPIYPDPTQPWKRYVPDDFYKKPRHFQSTSKNPDQIKAMKDFMRGMEEDVQTFEVTMKSTNGNDTRRLLSRIYCYDVKKIHIHRKPKTPGRSVTTLSITKETYDLKSYTVHPYYLSTGNEPPLANDKLPEATLIQKINENAMYGHYGPGTFWCRNQRCKQQKTVTAAAVVNYGRSHRFHLTQRFFCDMKNVIYMLHCQVCADQSTEDIPCYACHVGRCRAKRGIPNRLSYHLRPVRSNRNGGYQIYTEEQIRRFIANNQDPHDFRQDSPVHFNFEHPGGTSCVRLTILNRAVGTPENQGQLEEKRKLEAGSYNYMRFGRGGLNRRSNN